MKFLHLLFVYAIIFGLFEAFWRRSHGGGLFHDWYDKWIKPWLKINYRIPSVIVNSIAIFCLGVGLRGMIWWQAGLFALVVWAFWDVTFGMYMGIGMHPYPGDEDKAEYDRQYPVVWILNSLFSDSHDPIYGRYGIWYDFCGMWLRFTYPLIPLLFLPTFSPWILALGLLVAICYYVNVWMFDWCNSELTAGFAAGMLFALA